MADHPLITVPMAELWYSLPSVLHRDVLCRLTLTDVICMSAACVAIRRSMCALTDWVALVEDVVTQQLSQSRAKLNDAGVERLFAMLCAQQYRMTNVPPFFIRSRSSARSVRTLNRMSRVLASEWTDALITSIMCFVRATEEGEQAATEFNTPHSLGEEATGVWQERCVEFERWVRLTSKLCVTEVLPSLDDLDDMEHISENVWLLTQVNAFCSRFPNHRRHIPDLLCCARMVVGDHLRIRRLQRCLWNEVLAELAANPMMHTFKSHLQHLAETTSLRDLATVMSQDIVPSLKRARRGPPKWR